MSNKFITPNSASGFRDYLPQTMIPREKMLQTIKMVFESFGFQPLETPGVEREEILTGGDPNFKMNIYRLQNSNSESGSELALRFDLTVPLARVIAAYPNDLIKPFKRYQTGSVWRGERPQQGRFREFRQFDADIVGAKSNLADAEIIALMFKTVEALQIPNFLIRVNTRKILNGLSEYANFEKSITTGVLRILDKIDKIEWEGVEKELREALKLEQEQTEKIKKFLDLNGLPKTELLNALQQEMQNSPSAIEGVKELSEIMLALKAYNIPETAWKIDLSVARGLGYYTGPVFETILLDLPNIGSVFSGGRYDGLVERFSPSQIPATGASVGVDRLFAALEILGLVTKEKTVTKVLVLNFEPKAISVVIETCAILRQTGINTDLYLDGDVSLKEQLGFASKAEIPIAIIIGETELKDGTAIIRDMTTRKQITVPISKIAENI